MFLVQFLFFCIVLIQIVTIYYIASLRSEFQSLSTKVNLDVQRVIIRLYGSNAS